MKNLLVAIIISMTFFQVFGQKTNPKYLDSCVNNICLRDPNSVGRILGEGKDYLDYDDDETDVINNDSSQILTMIFYSGGTTNEFYAFKVCYNNNRLRPSLKMQTEEFITNRKIKLGLQENQVESILGTPTQKSTENGITIWRYEEKDELYFGRYDFKDGRLIQFWFGENYP